MENIIRSDIDSELLEILELYCELLIARIGLLEAKECDPGLEEAVKSIIYAAPRTDVKELQQCRQLLVEKFGKEFAMAAVENSDGKISERVVRKLRIQPPSQELVTLYLKEIANTYDIDWPKVKEEPEGKPIEEDEQIQDHDEPPQIEEPVSEPTAKNINAKDSDAGSVEKQASPTQAQTQVMSFPTPPEPRVSKPLSNTRRSQERLGPSSPEAPAPRGPKMDDLATRFAALKKGL